jgi:hypothetical protein
MTVTIYKVHNAVGKEIGVIHIPHYEKWGSGNIFKTAPYAMTQNQKRMNLTVTVDSRGAHLLAAVNIFSPGSNYYQWRQTVQITNQDGTLVDVADYLLPGGKFNHAASKRLHNWDLDQQATNHDWYWSTSSRAQAVYKNRVYWHTQGVPIDPKVADHFCLFEDNPNQPTHLLAKCGPFGILPEIQKHPVTGIPMAREINKQVRLKFATSLVETQSANQINGGDVLSRFVWGFFMDYDGTSTLYPLRRDS